MRSRDHQGRRVEGERVEVGLGLLEVGLPRHALRLGLRDQRADGQLGKGHGGDCRHARHLGRIPQPAMQDDRPEQPLMRLQEVARQYILLVVAKERLPGRIWPDPPGGRTSLMCFWIVRLCNRIRGGYRSRAACGRFYRFER